MSRGGSYGGGQSSLGYLFGSEEKPAAPPAPQTVSLPPYGIDTTTEKPQDNQAPNKPNVSNNYHRAQGQNTGNFITVSTENIHWSIHLCSIYLYVVSLFHLPHNKSRFFRIVPQQKLNQFPVETPHSAICLEISDICVLYYFLLACLK